MIGAKFVQALDDWSPGTERDLVVQDGGVRLLARLVDVDKLSCSLERLQLETNPAQPLDPEQLTEWGKRLGSRITYLLEALHAIELDKEHGQLLLRSHTPEKKSSATLFYELLLQATGRLSLERRKYVPETREHQGVHMTFTREVLEKLADDLELTRPQ